MLRDPASNPPVMYAQQWRDEHTPPESHHEDWHEFDLSDYADLPPHSRVAIFLDDGLVREVIGLPASTFVEVRDYDIDGAAPEELETDESGDKYSTYPV